MFNTYVIPSTHSDSLFASYYKEREGKETIFHSVDSMTVGFATYKWVDDGCYIVDIFVVPDFRSKNIASKLADDISVIARERGCKFLWGSVDITADTSDQSMQVLLKYGMKMNHINGNMIYLKKDLGDK